MKLGIDIDGCLNNFQEAMATIIKRDYGVVTPKNIYYMVEELNLSKEEFGKFWKKYNPELLDLMDIQPGSIENLKKLQGLGCNLNIITARDYSVATLTQEWLHKHQVPYDEIYFNGEKKHQVCNWQKINLMIEDNPEYAKALADSGVNVMLYSRPYNEDFKYEKVQIVNNWDEIYKIVYNEMLAKF